MYFIDFIMEKRLVVLSSMPTHPPISEICPLNFERSFRFESKMFSLCIFSWKQKCERSAIRHNKNLFVWWFRNNKLYTFFESSHCLTHSYQKSAGRAIQSKNDHPFRKSFQYNFFSRSSSILSHSSNEYSTNWSANDSARNVLLLFQPKINNQSSIAFFPLTI